MEARSSWAARMDTLVAFGQFVGEWQLLRRFVALVSLPWAVLFDVLARGSGRTNKWCRRHRVLLSRVAGILWFCSTVVWVLPPAVRRWVWLGPGRECEHGVCDLPSWPLGGPSSEREFKVVVRLDMSFVEWVSAAYTLVQAVSMMMLTFLLNSAIIVIKFPLTAVLLCLAILCCEAGLAS